MEKNDLVGDALKIMPPEYVPLLYQRECMPVSLPQRER